MPDLSNYTGKPLNGFASRFIDTLEAEGFTVALTVQGPIKGARKTLRIFWRSMFIGLMNASLWGRKDPYACLYRFPTDQDTNSIARAPLGFDKDDFARRHGCSSEQLHVHTDDSGAYLWVKDEATGLHLMRDWARRVDAVFLEAARC